MCYSLIFIFCSLFTSSVSLLCYSKTCPQTKVDLCIERCPTSYNACKAVVQVDYGTHTNVELSCIQSDENCDDSYHFCVPKRTNVSNILICCCSTDYCNGGFRDAKKLYPWLTVSRLLPLLPIPAQISDVPVCELYVCIKNQSYPHCYHSYQKCPQPEGFVSQFTCHSQYKYTNGYLVPVFKGCSYVPIGTIISHGECHVDNPVVASNGTFSCYCTGNYCNQNETFTHVTKLASYGKVECKEMGCQYTCLVVDNAPRCQCPIGYTKSNETHCQDIDECKDNKGGCHQVCVNTEGSYFCTCWQGFRYDSFSDTCQENKAIFCLYRICFDECEGDLVSRGCTNQLETDEYPELQYCLAYYFHVNRETWRPHVQWCHRSIYSDNRECLEKTECQLELYQDEPHFPGPLYYCCCRGDNCNDPFMPRNLTASPSVSYIGNTTSEDKIITITESVVLGTRSPMHVTLDSGSWPVNLDIVLAIFMSILFILIIILLLLSFYVHSVRSKYKKVLKPKFHRLIAKGQFSELHIATLSDTQHIIKLFDNSQNGKTLWEKANNLQSYLVFAKSNVLQYQSSHEECLYAGNIVYCLVGRSTSIVCSLHTYLQGNIITFSEFSSLSMSAVSGLAYLHMYMVKSSVTKHSIVHRYINSDNFLVRADMNCVLCNFEYALPLTGRKTPDGSNELVNSVRYVAPEMLEAEARTFQAICLQRIDVYAMGLVLWEMAHRCTLPNGGPVLKHILPFQGLVPYNPTISDMKKVVVDEAIRPNFPVRFFKQGYYSIVETISECWYHEPDARPSVELVKHRLTTILESSVPDLRAITLDSSPTNLFQSNHSRGSSCFLEIHQEEHYRSADVSDNCVEQAQGSHSYGISRSQSQTFGKRNFSNGHKRSHSLHLY